VIDTLKGYSYEKRLRSNEKLMFVDKTKSLVKSKSILLILKEHNEDNVITIE